MYTQQINIGRWLTLVGYFSLMVGLYSWHLVINDTAKHLISIIVLLQIGPLLFPIRGLLNKSTYTHAWSMYLAIYYFIVGVWYGAADESFLFGLYVVFTSLTFYLGTVLFTRFSGKERSQEAVDSQDN